ncbi:beta-ketoacyl-[acyl-carrier-protein] synthase family protein [Pinibacter soli]|uniref:Beta-ketoacyl synthase N-terminal-like domain-containing protein n=1 Tax=Pinibacter soli TaxID=3044211 RepID=A0ABT6RE07_9BACT|nr:beta-ketoacyl synthase N-terminal-like domain-containing protein [Pinibacter soli]MDI3320099.1 beta-ketoacyl synthase N-terminal-like domain-containing protein [Pinibacter soli]
MPKVFVVADNIYSPLGSTTAENFSELLKGNSGVRRHSRPEIFSEPFFAAIFSQEKNQEFSTGIQNANKYTKFEKLLIHSIKNALSLCDVDIQSASTAIIISTTKGNISLLENEIVTGEMKAQLPLHSSAKAVADYFHNPNLPVTISNACISGISALLTAKRLIETDQYENVIVAGADVISSFIFSGFNSFQAISKQVCKPFDADRSGINLGEAAATIILSKHNKNAYATLDGGSVSNDANHISGPSRTGEELAIAIKKAMQEADAKPDAIDFISGHGTATLYNDEMEAKAINIAGLQQVPVNSLKPYFGHTLGAAGILESVVALSTMKQNTIIPTLGFESIGVPVPVNVPNTITTKNVNKILKIAAGFGGCNAALVFSKN